MAKGLTAAGRLLGRGGSPDGLPKDARATRSWALVAALVVAVVAALLAATTALVYFAYDRQSGRVEELQSRDDKILRDHAAIGAQFAHQSARLDKTVDAVQAAYGRGFRAGVRAERLPPQFGRLWLSVQQGYAVPVAVPARLRGATPTVRRTARGYTVRWEGIALFARSRTPVSDWTEQAWPGTQRRLRLGIRAVRRLLGPFGVVYVWRERRKTYAIVARRPFEPLVRPLARTIK